jgi:hypothetical protein
MMPRSLTSHVIIGLNLIALAAQTSCGEQGQQKDRPTQALTGK